MPAATASTTCGPPRPAPPGPCWPPTGPASSPRRSPPAEISAHAGRGRERRARCRATAATSSSHSGSVVYAWTDSRINVAPSSSSTGISIRCASHRSPLSASRRVDVEVGGHHLRRPQAGRGSRHRAGLGHKRAASVRSARRVAAGDDRGPVVGAPELDRRGDREERGRIERPGPGEATLIGVVARPCPPPRDDRPADPLPGVRARVNKRRAARGQKPLVRVSDVDVRAGPGEIELDLARPVGAVHHRDHALSPGLGADPRDREQRARERGDVRAGTRSACAG